MKQIRDRLSKVERVAQFAQSNSARIDVLEKDGRIAFERMAQFQADVDGLRHAFARLRELVERRTAPPSRRPARRSPAARP